MDKFRKAKLNDRDNDLSKQWYVEYMFQHPEKQVLIPFRKYISLRLKTGLSRRTKADKLITEINEWLMMGGNPFAQENLSKTNVVIALDRLAALKKASTRSRTASTYKGTITKIKEFLKVKRLSDIAVEDVSSIVAQQFCDYMVEDLALANRTHNNHLNNLRTLWNMMKKRYNIHINPWSAIDMLEEEESSNVCFTTEEIKIIDEHLMEDSFELWCCACLIFYCAIRPAEIVRLQAYNFMLDKGVIYLDGRITKNKKTQLVTIPSEAFIEDLIKLTTGLPKNIYVFSRKLKPGDKEVAPTRIFEAWNEWRKKYGLQNTIYTFKHNVAVMLSDSGATDRDIQIHFRHHSLAYTEKYMNRVRKTVGPQFILKYPKL